MAKPKLLCRGQHLIVLVAEQAFVPDHAADCTPLGPLVNNPVQPSDVHAFFL